jgi:ectoine hydroxylase-related dioxygenase (phytanoyl-CoA dioxygenase family)
MPMLDARYTIVPQVLDAAMLERTRTHSQRVLAAVSPEHRAQQRATGSLIHIAADPFFAELIASRPALSALERLGLGHAAFSSGYVISKPPRSPALFWHQDWWGWGDPVSYTDRPMQVFLMYYLTDTRPGNGCLRVLPGSHRRRHPMHDLLPSAHAEDLARVTRPESPIYQSAEGEVPVAVQAGDLVVGDARLLHGAFPNDSDEERTLITLWFHPHFADQP